MFSWDPTNVSNIVKFEVMFMQKWPKVIDLTLNKLQPMLTIIMAEWYKLVRKKVYACNYSMLF